MAGHYTSRSWAAVAGDFCAYPNPPAPRCRRCPRGGAQMEFPSYQQWRQSLAEEHCEQPWVAVAGDTCASISPPASRCRRSPRGPAQMTLSPYHQRGQRLAEENYEQRPPPADLAAKTLRSTSLPPARPRRCSPPPPLLLRCLSRGLLSVMGHGNSREQHHQQCHHHHRCSCCRYCCRYISGGDRGLPCLHRRAPLPRLLRRSRRC